MAAEWYFVIGGQRFGPVSSTHLREMAASGRLKPTDLVWRPGLKSWVPAGQVKGIFPTVPDGAAKPSEAEPRSSATPDPKKGESPGSLPPTGVAVEETESAPALEELPSLPQDRSVSPEVVRKVQLEPRQASSPQTAASGAAAIGPSEEESDLDAGAALAPAPPPTLGRLLEEQVPIDHLTTPFPSLYWVIPTLQAVNQCAVSIIWWIGVSAGFVILILATLNPGNQSSSVSPFNVGNGNIGGSDHTS